MVSYQCRCSELLLDGGRGCSIEQYANFSTSADYGHTATASKRAAY